MENYIIKFRYKQKIFSIKQLKLKDIKFEYIKALRNEKFLVTIPKKITINKQKTIVKKINKDTSQKILGFFYKSKLIGTSGFQNLNKKKVNIGIFLFNKQILGKGFGKVFIWFACFYIFHFFKKEYFIAGIMTKNLKSLGAFKGAGFKLLNKKKESLNFFLKIKSKKPKFVKSSKLIF